MGPPGLFVEEKLLSAFDLAAEELAPFPFSAAAQLASAAIDPGSRFAADVGSRRIDTCRLGSLALRAMLLSRDESLSPVALSSVEDWS